MPGSCDLTSVSLYCNSTTYFQGVYDNVEIVVCHTSFNVLRDTFNENYDGSLPFKVFDRSVLSLDWTPNAWNDIVFDTPFSYNGTDNYIIEFRFDGCDGRNIYVRGASSPTYRVLDGYPGQTTGFLRDYINNMRIHYTGGPTVSAGLTCVPDSGTLPFVTAINLSITNNVTDQVRRMAGRLDVEMAGGATVTSWKAGWTNLTGGETFSTGWNQTLPALGGLLGTNTFRFTAADVTPPPYNQPPYQPSGDSDTESCDVVGLAP